MKLEKKNNNIYEVFNVGNTDYFVEVRNNGKWIEVWLCKEDFGIKNFMFGIENVNNYVDIIKNNVAKYISIYERDYVDYD